MRNRLILFCVSTLLIASSNLLAGPVPSKTAPGQTIEGRDADLSLVTNVVDNEDVAAALRTQGLSPTQVQDRISRLSDGDLHRLAGNLNQLQSAGHGGGSSMSRKWIWIGVGVLAALILIAAL